MIKVLHIITDANIGGAGSHLLTFFPVADRKTFSYEVALPTGSKLISKLDVPYTELPNIAARSFSIKGLLALYRLVKQKSPDIVHTHASLAGRIAARLCGCKIVHTRHSVFAPTGRSFAFLNQRLSDAIIAVSPAAKENLVQMGIKPESISVIFNGIKPVRRYSEQEKNDIRASYGIKPGAFVVSQLARLIDIKGHDYTLDAAKKWPDITVLIAGEGPHEEHLRRRAKEESISNVIFMGFIDKVADIHNISDLQINTSYGTEATSYSLLDGMSLGIPAVVSDFGGNPYVITHSKNGLVFPEKDANALADAVLQIKNDSTLYQKLSKGAIEEFESRFKIEDMAKHMENLYQSLIGESTSIRHRRLSNERF